MFRIESLVIHRSSKLFVSLALLLLFATHCDALFHNLHRSPTFDPFSHTRILEQLQQQRQQLARANALQEHCSLLATKTQPLQHSVRLNVEDQPQRISLSATVPGLRVDDIKVESDDRRGTLRIQAVRHPPVGCERFVRPDVLDKAFLLPSSISRVVDWDQLSATYENDALRILIAKKLSEREASSIELPSHSSHTADSASPRADFTSSSSSSAAASASASSSRCDPHSQCQTESSSSVPVDVLLRAFSDFEHELDAKAMDSSKHNTASGRSADNNTKQEDEDGCNRTNMKGGRRVPSAEPSWYHTPLAACTSEERAKRFDASDEGVVEL